MKKGDIVLLVFACLFATVTGVLLLFEAILVFGAFDAIYKPGNDGWDALGGVFLYVYAILIAIGSGISAAVTLPFNLVLMKRTGKKWYNFAILGFTITAVVLAVALAVALPIVSHLAPNHSTSSSSASSAVALMLF